MVTETSLSDLIAKGTFTLTPEVQRDLGHDFAERDMRIIRDDIANGLSPRGSGYDGDGNVRSWFNVPASIQRSIFCGGLLLCSHISDMSSWKNGKPLPVTTYHWMVNATHFARLTVPEFVRAYPVTQKSQRWGCNPKGTNLYVDRRDPNSQHDLVEKLSPGAMKDAKSVKGTQQERHVFTSKSLIRILGTMGLLDWSNTGSQIPGAKQRWSDGKAYLDELFHFWTLKYQATRNLINFEVCKLSQHPEVADYFARDILSVHVHDWEVTINDTPYE